MSHISWLVSHQNQHFGDKYKKSNVRSKKLYNLSFDCSSNQFWILNVDFNFRFYLPISAERRKRMISNDECHIDIVGTPHIPTSCMASTISNKYGTQIQSAIFRLILLISHQTSSTYICATRVDAYACDACYIHPQLLSFSEIFFRFIKTDLV